MTSCTESIFAAPPRNFLSSKSAKSAINFSLQNEAPKLLRRRNGTATLKSDTWTMAIPPLVIHDFIHPLLSIHRSIHPSRRSTSVFHCIKVSFKLRAFQISKGWSWFFSLSCFTFFGSISMEKGKETLSTSKLCST